MPQGSLKTPGSMKNGRNSAADGLKLVWFYRKSKKHRRLQVGYRFLMDIRDSGNSAKENSGK